MPTHESKGATMTARILTTRLPSQARFAAAAIAISASILMAAASARPAGASVAYYPDHSRPTGLACHYSIYGNSNDMAAHREILYYTPTYTLGYTTDHFEYVYFRLVAAALINGRWEWTYANWRITDYPVSATKSGIFGTVQYENWEAPSPLLVRASVTTWVGYQMYWPELGNDLYTDWMQQMTCP
jgi:hypothetical protein